VHGLDDDGRRVQHGTRSGVTRRDSEVVERLCGLRRQQPVRDDLYVGVETEIPGFDPGPGVFLAEPDRLVPQRVNGRLRIALVSLLL